MGAGRVMAHVSPLGLTVVRHLEAFGKWGAGAIAGYSEDEAANMVKRGVAEYYIPPDAADAADAAEAVEAAGQPPRRGRR